MMCSKTNTKSLIGPEGLRYILQELHNRNCSRPKVNVPVVCIGGLNASNIYQVMYRGNHAANALSGVAVVSAIVAAEDPQAAARHLKSLVGLSQGLVLQRMGKTHFSTRQELLELVPKAIKMLHEKKPLSHNMTNLVNPSIPRPLSTVSVYDSFRCTNRHKVVQNFAANVALCVGASPIMANYGEEAEDLARLGGALVINMGTVTPEGIENYKKALRAYNAALRPVVFDPVG